MESHKEIIECLSCNHIQTANVLHTEPLWTHKHTCEKCKFPITEEDWAAPFENDEQNIYFCSYCGEHKKRIEFTDPITPYDEGNICDKCAEGDMEVFLKETDNNFKRGREKIKDNNKPSQS